MTTQAALDFMNKLPTTTSFTKGWALFWSRSLKQIFSVIAKDQIQQKITTIFSHHNKYSPLLILSGLYRSKNIFRKGSCSQICRCSFWKNNLIPLCSRKLSRVGSINTDQIVAMRERPAFSKTLRFSIHNIKLWWRPRCDIQIQNRLGETLYLGLRDSKGKWIYEPWGQWSGIIWNCTRGHP